MAEPLVASLTWGQPEFGDYALFYRRAGDRLLGMASVDPDATKGLAIPILYLYRHAVELALKDANIWAEAALAMEPDPNRQRTPESVRRQLERHTLQPLLDHLGDCLSLLQRGTAQPDLAVQMTKVVGPAALAFDKFDEDGQRFRYPYLSKGRGPSWPRGSIRPTSIDLAIVRSTVEPALDFLLETLGDWLSARVDLAIEDSWIAGLWEAEAQARRVAAAWAPWEGDAGGGLLAHDELTDDIKSESLSDLFRDHDH